MTCFWRIIALTSALAAGCASVFGQTEQPVVWVVECNDATTYRGDVTDSTKLARDPGATTALPVRAFQVTYNVADIVLINGKPAKGLMSTMNGALAPRVSPQPGLSIGDFDGGGPFMAHFTILAPDGTPVGAVWAGGGVLAPDMVSTIWAGSGAFLGMAGETRSLEVMTPYRAASVTEDPANRRLHGGGRVRFMWSLYPKYRPSVDVTPAGPSVFHGDLQPVTAARPARAGEVLIVRARNLGPTRPDLLPPGSRPFKTDPLEPVNSPLEVTINGTAAEVVNKVGWPGTLDQYRVDFRIPSGLTPGTATIQLTAAWIPGPTVDIPVQ